MSATLDLTASRLPRHAAEVLEDPALHPVRERLRSGAIVADLGARSGASTIAMAAAYPRSAFVGYDADALCVDAARRRARADGAGDNVRFQATAITALPAHGYDVVTSFDAPHELGPAEPVARRVREALADDGVWVLRAPAGIAEPVPHLVRAILRRAGFRSVRLVTWRPSEVVVEARP